MNKRRSTLGVLAAFLFIITCSTAGQAVAFRTFVAGPGVGSDANTVSDCPVSAPCRNFSAAYSVTSPGGEIIALTTAGYGGLTITHAITIQAAPGQFAFIGVVPASTGIVVSAGVSENVVIRNLQFSGNPPLVSGTTGIQHNSGKLLIENCTFGGLATGIQVNNAKTDVVNCDIVSNLTGISTTGTGYDQSCTNPPFAGNWPGDATAQVRIDRGTLSNNSTGILMNNPGTIHSQCFCNPICPFPTVTPSINPTQNLITVFMHSTDSNQIATINITGNTNFITGSGASCTATPGMCNTAIKYTETNPK